MKTIGIARTLAGLGLAALIVGSSGCVVETSSNECRADLQVSWSIFESGTGVQLTCDQVPADTVQVVLDGTPYSFNCVDGGARVNGIPLGNHTAQLRLLDGAANVSDTGAMTIALTSCILYDLNGGADVPFEVN